MATEDKQSMKEYLGFVTEQAKEVIAKKSETETKNRTYFQRINPRGVPAEPIILSGSVGVGTPVVRANHHDALLAFYQREETLKTQGAPIGYDW